MIILGLAIATSQHHAAALVVDGQVIGAVEEERLNGVKAYGWSPPGSPEANIINTPGIKISDAVCRKSVHWLLNQAGIGMDDVDAIAVNGIPFRYRGTRECVQVGRYVFVPHHLAHAAIAARISPYSEGNVLTVDGRGEYETAALFTWKNGLLERRFEVEAGNGCSFGGAYETVTRVLGFGSQGQGQTMALASLEAGRADAFGDAFSVSGWESVSIDEHAIQTIARRRMGTETGADSPQGRALAADIQASLESALLALAKDGQTRHPAQHWMVAGGVGLNCCANSLIREALDAEVWVTHAAHDGGTALGAALEAAHLLGEPKPNPVLDAGLGPGFSQAQAMQAIETAGLTAKDNALDEVVCRMVDGQVFGWFSGRLEYGPRALGHRSIVAHPGYPGIADKVNGIKARQLWRPFGPSVLAEHGKTWLEPGRGGPFMTFTERVRDDYAGRVPGVVHADQSTRPQWVDEHSEPRWRDLITRFETATGIPLILNTSFNGRGRPIVCSPDDAIKEARDLGLDGLVIEGLLVDLNR